MGLSAIGSNLTEICFVLFLTDLPVKWDLNSWAYGSWIVTWPFLGIRSWCFPQKNFVFGANLHLNFPWPLLVQNDWSIMIQKQNLRNSKLQNKTSDMITGNPTSVHLNMTVVTARVSLHSSSWLVQSPLSPPSNCSYPSQLTRQSWR